MRYDDDHNLIDDDNGSDEYEGYSVVDGEGNELSVSRGASTKKKENWDDGEIPEASPIPENEQTVIMDNADVTDIEVGDPLTLVLTGSASGVFYGSVKAGDLKPAFVAKLTETRKGMYVGCELASKVAPVMVKLKFYTSARTNTVKIG